MGTLYKNISQLCSERNIKPGKMCADTGISRGLITDLKMERKNSITVDTAKKIADYFGVSVDRVLGSDQKEKPTTETDGELTQEQVRAIEKIKNMPPEELAKKMAPLEALLDM